jgi:hypothetical protein
MRILLVVMVLVVIIGALATWLPAHPGHPPAASPFSPPVSSSAAPQNAHTLAVRTNPRGGLLTAVEQAIGGAQHQVLLLGSLRGAERIAAALVAARDRGVEVQVVAPAAAGGPDDVLRSLPETGIAVAIDAEHRGMSTTLLVIDGAAAILGGTLADSAERDDAGMAWFAQDPQLAADCLTTWRTHRAHAQPLPVAGAAADATAPPAGGTIAPPAAPPGPTRVDAVPAADAASPFHTTHRDLDH